MRGLGERERRVGGERGGRERVRGVRGLRERERKVKNEHVIFLNDVVINRRESGKEGMGRE